MNIEPYNNFLEVVEKGNTKELLHLISTSKLFNVSDEKNWLFLNTKPNIDEEVLMLPFEQIFINKTIKMFNCEVNGILINKVDKETISVYMVIYAEDINMTSLFVHDYNLRTKQWKDASYEEVSNSEKKTIKAIVEYISNMLLFLNEPRVVIYDELPNTNKNKQRERKGLIPVPTLLKTRITDAKFKQYINIHYQSHSKLGYRFLVAGHWRVLRSPRYGSNVGKKILIAPHYKGQGIIANQIWSIE